MSLPRHIIRPKPDNRSEDRKTQDKYPWILGRTFDKIEDGTENTRYLSGEPSLSMLEEMVLNAIANKRRRPITVDFHVLSVLDDKNKNDKKKIDAVTKALKKLKTKLVKEGINLNPLHNTASMADHQMRNSKGELLDFTSMDDYLRKHRESKTKDGIQISMIHCKAGQGRSATIMTCEDIRYNGLLPSESSIQTKNSRPNARGIQDNAFRPDQVCFMYAYFFYAAAEALAAEAKTKAEAEALNLATPSNAEAKAKTLAAEPLNTSNAEALSKDTSRSYKLIETLKTMVGGQPPAATKALIDEMRYALSIDYSKNLDKPGNAQTEQWSKILAETFLSFRNQFQATHKVDILENLLDDCNNNPSNYSPAQIINLQKFCIKTLENDVSLPPEKRDKIANWAGNNLEFTDTALKAAKREQTKLTSSRWYKFKNFFHRLIWKNDLLTDSLIKNQLKIDTLTSIKTGVEAAILQEKQKADALSQFKAWVTENEQKLTAANKQNLVQQYMLNPNHPAENPGDKEKLNIMLSICSKEELGKDLMSALSKLYPVSMESKLAHTVANLREAPGHQSWIQHSTATPQSSTKESMAQKKEEKKQQEKKEESEETTTRSLVI